MTPNKKSTKSSYPQKNHLSENPKYIEIKNFEVSKGAKIRNRPDPGYQWIQTPQNGPSLRVYENIRVPPPPRV